MSRRGNRHKTAQPQEHQHTPPAAPATPLARAAAYIGLNLTGPERASAFEIGLYALLIFVPFSLASSLLGWGEGWEFLLSALAILPLAKILSTATERLSARTGPGIGGLLSATFGNAVEMIIAFFALQAGLFEVVKASITGAILGNMLFVLGLAMFVGGLGREKQSFNRTAAGVSASQLLLAAGGLFIPAAFVLTVPTSVLTTDLREELSVGVAVLLLVGYVAQLVFSLRTHRHLYEEGEEPEAHVGGEWTMQHSVIVLLTTTVVVAVIAEILVGGLEFLTTTLNLSELFVGVIIIALVGGAAEGVTAVLVARKGNMPLALNVVMSSTLQISLFVAPVLVLLGAFTGHPLTLTFNEFEVAAILLTMIIANAITHDGESNWFEGVQLLITYAILAVAFFFHP